MGLLLLFYMLCWFSVVVLDFPWELGGRALFFFSLQSLLSFSCFLEVGWGTWWTALWLLCSLVSSAAVVVFLCNFYCLYCHLGFGWAGLSSINGSSLLCLHCCVFVAVSSLLCFYRLFYPLSAYPLEVGWGIGGRLFIPLLNLLLLYFM